MCSYVKEVGSSMFGVQSSVFGVGSRKSEVGRPKREDGSIDQLFKSKKANGLTSFALVLEVKKASSIQPRLLSL